MIRPVARTLSSGLMIAGLLCGNATGAPLASAADIRAALAAYVAGYPHAEVIVGVVEGDQTAVYAANGAAAGSPDERTIFQIGSITKTFTATLLSQMVQSGQVALDDPISKYLPPGVSAPSYGGKPITLLTLAEQTSGLPRMPPNLTPQSMSNPYAAYTAKELFAALPQTHLTRAPGAEYEYSNYAVTLLGQLLADRARSSYADLIATRILRPLHMNDTTVVGTQASRVMLAPGYAADGTPEPAWDFGALGAAGSIESDMHDMLIYLKANLAAPAGVLGPAMANAQLPRVASGLNGIMRIGLIWQTNVRSGITWHNGQTGGYHSFIGFDRRARHGVVVLTNVSDMNVDQLAVHVLAPYIPAPAPPASAAPKEPSPYNGVYPLSSSFAITIFKSGGKLYAQATAQPAFELTASGPNAYRTIGVDALITFDVDAKGNATGLTLHQNGLDQHADRTP